MSIYTHLASCVRLSAIGPERWAANERAALTLVSWLEAQQAHGPGPQTDFAHAVYEQTLAAALGVAEQLGKPKAT